MSKSNSTNSADTEDLQKVTLLLGFISSIGSVYNGYAEPLAAVIRAARASTPAAVDVAAASIDTPEFRGLFNAVGNAPWRFDGRRPAMDALIAHINAWGARLAAGVPAETVKTAMTFDAPQIEATTAPARPELSVLYCSMPESNGKANWTATLTRKGDTGLDMWGNGFTFSRSEYPDRVRYEADCMRFLIGEIADEPFMLDYDDKKHSGYVAPATAPDVAKDADRLEWSEEARPNSECSYDHVIAKTPFGRILITWKSWKDDPAPTVDEHPVEGYFYVGNDVDDAKENAEAAYFAAMGALPPAGSEKGGA